MSGERWTQDIFFWMRWALMVVSCLSVLYFRFSVVVSVCLLAWKRHKPTLSDKDFVDRPGLQNQLLEKLESDDFETVLLYGERGSGKSSLVEHALKDRYGVVFINIKKNTRTEAMDEMDEKLLKMIDWLGRSSQNSEFLEHVFSWCWFVPVIVISLEAKCSGDVFEGIITSAKVLSYENRGRGAPRIVVDISGSRAAVEADISLQKRRVIGVMVGALEQDQAEKFIMNFIPDSFKDDLRRKELAKKVMKKLDCLALKLKEAGRYVKETKPTTVAAFETAIDAFFLREVKQASRGWSSFKKSFDQIFEAELKDEVYGRVATKLLEGTQDSVDVCNILREGLLELDTRKSSIVTWADIGSANSSCDYHPLFIDPFESTYRLAGKAVIAMLQETVSKAV